MNEKYINKILELAKLASEKECVPVGAIVVKDNQIIGEGYNLKELTKNPLDHAEIIAIQNACKTQNSWNLKDCELYVTMMPCVMCRGVINEVRIKNIYYLISNEKEKYKNLQSVNNMNFRQISTKNTEEFYISVLRDFFSKKRKKSRKTE